MVELDKVFYFGMNQLVKVQLLGTVIYGTIVNRTVEEGSYGVRLSYNIKFPSHNSFDTITYNEKFLIYTQRLKVEVQND